MSRPSVIGYNQNSLMLHETVIWAQCELWTLLEMTQQSETSGHWQSVRGVGLGDSRPRAWDPIGTVSEAAGPAFWRSLLPHATDVRGS